jgi:hypothetical protein
MPSKARDLTIFGITTIVWCIGWLVLPDAKPLAIEMAAFGAATVAYALHLWRHAGSGPPRSS